jgi:hypothetical protein
LDNDVAKVASVDGDGGSGAIGCVRWVGPPERTVETVGLTYRFACKEATRRTAATASVIDRNFLSFVPARVGLGSSSYLCLKLGSTIAHS